MQPIQELIDRIHWDPEFSQGDFEIGFLDKLEHREIRMPFDTLHFEKGDHFFFYFLDSEGVEHQVPFHRIKSVYKNGELIWHREH